MILNSAICRTALRATVFVSLLLLAAPTAFAQKWAEDMFEVKEIEMGNVARGAESRFRLKFKNLYKEQLHISRVATGCSCITAKASSETLQSLDTAYIEIVLDTVKFVGDRQSSVTVTFDLPFPGEVRIPFHVFIRNDIVLTPGLADFGSLSRGASSERRIQIAYAGRADWTISKVQNGNPLLDAEVKETARANGRVNYELVVKVKPDAPVGDLRTQLTLITDDEKNPRIPVLVEGRIDPEFTAAPDVLQYGTMQPGERKTLKIIVRSTSGKAFKIDTVESEKTAGAFETVIDKNKQASTHLVPLTFVAPKEAMTLSEEFTITIPGANGTMEHIKFRVLGKVTGSTASAKPISP